MPTSNIEPTSKSTCNKPLTRIHNTFAKVINKKCFTKILKKVEPKSEKVYTLSRDTCTNQLKIKSNNTCACVCVCVCAQGYMCELKVH